MRLFDISKNTKVTGDKSGQYFFGQVTQVSFDKESPDSIGTVTYRLLSDQEGINRGVAYPLFPAIKNIPLVDEIILCIVAPSEEQEASDKFSKAYYISSVNIWNHPQHAGYTREKKEVSLHPDFKESPDINPMFPFPGDIILEGRRGQSIRFSETQKDTPWTGSNLNTPIIVISNGQIDTENGFDFITEDINTDFASIYLTSTQQIPLGTQYTKSTSFDTAPVPTPYYTGSQALINSGRIYLNANKERVLINGLDGVGLAGQTINLDAAKHIALDSNEIYLLADAKNQKEHAVLGDSLVSELDTLYGDLQNVMSELGVLASTVGYLPLIEAASSVLTNLEVRQKKLRSKLLSKRIYLSK